VFFFVLGGFAFGKGTVDHFPAFPGVGPLLSGGFASSLVFVIYAYSGWNAAAYMGGEIREPSRNIPLALVIGTSVVIILYLLLNLLFVYALPIGRMSGVIEVGAEAALALFGPAVGKFFSAMVMFCLLSMISAMVMTGPRIYYAMARDRIFFNSFGRVRGTSGTPAASILLQGAIAIAMVLTSTFDALLLYVGFTLSIFSMFTVVGMMRLRRRRPEAHRPYKTYGYPLTPLLFVLGNLWIIAFFIKENPVISLYGAGTIVSGIVVYLCFHRYYGTDRNKNQGGTLS
jgi:APA family basic amino acid/polyamine antiporter